jgi:F420-non-reducing hydrogenase iron-sulfur subunit
MADTRTNVVGFLCEWCSYAGADHAGGLRLDYSPAVRLIRVPCTGRIDPQFVMAAFREGADGVLLLGCHPGDCHYRSGNHKAERRSRILSPLLAGLGVDPRRLRLDWVGAAEGEKLHGIVDSFAGEIEDLGPLALRGHRTEMKA